MQAVSVGQVVVYGPRTRRSHIVTMIVSTYDPHTKEATFSVGMACSKRYEEWWSDISGMAENTRDLPLCSDCEKAVAEVKPKKPAPRPERLAERELEHERDPIRFTVSTKNLTYAWPYAIPLRVGDRVRLPGNMATDGYPWVDTVTALESDYRGMVRNALGRVDD